MVDVSHEEFHGHHSKSEIPVALEAALSAIEVQAVAGTGDHVLHPKTAAWPLTEAV